MVLYKKLIGEMNESHQDLFDRFEAVHRKFALNQRQHRGMFDLLGEKVKTVMLKYEQTLCGKSERSGMRVYSSKLADKYWTEIKKRYPLIDFVGVRIE